MSTSSKLDHMLSVQKSPSNKTGLGFVESISVPIPYSTNFAPLKKIMVDLQESKPKAPIHPKGKLHDKPAWVCHFCGKSGHIRPNCFKLQVAKRANNPKVPVPQAQDPMILIGELVKTLNLYSNPRVGNHSNVNKNSNARGASKKFWIKKAQSK